MAMMEVLFGSFVLHIVRNYGDLNYYYFFSCDDLVFLLVVVVLLLALFFYYYFQHEPDF